MTDTIKHGTYTGYNQHRKQGVPVCDDCRDAVNEYLRDYRIRKDLEQGLVTVPLEVLGRLLVAAPTYLEEWVEERIGATRVEVSMTAAADEHAAVSA